VISSSIACSPSASSATRLRCVAGCEGDRLEAGERDHPGTPYAPYRLPERPPQRELAAVYLAWL
jgi:hypothetical protein